MWTKKILFPTITETATMVKCHRTTEFHYLQESDRYYLHGRLWRAEWVEPTRQSSLNGYSETKDEFIVQLDNTSNKVNLSTLRYEEINKYLWFNPEVMNLLVANTRGKQVIIILRSI